MSVISIAIIAIAWILAPTIIKIIAPGFDSVEQFKLATTMMRIGLPAIIFAGIQGVFRGYLQSEHIFTETAAISFPFNFAYIFFLLFLSSCFGIKGLMVTSVIAVMSQVFLQINGMKKTRFKYE